jgi:hypothetical protein
MILSTDCSLGRPREGGIPLRSQKKEENKRIKEGESGKGSKKDKWGDRRVVYA